MSTPQTEAKRRRLEALEQRQVAARNVQPPLSISRPPNASGIIHPIDKKINGSVRPTSGRAPGSRPDLSQRAPHVANMSSPGWDTSTASQSHPEDPLYQEISKRLRGGWAVEGEEAAEWEYFLIQMSASDRPDPLATTSPTAAIESLLRSLLKSTNRSSDASAILESKVYGKNLLLHNPMGQAAASERRREREVRERAQRSKCRMGAKERREKKVFHIQPLHQKYALYAPLEALWKEYMTGLLKGSSDSMVLTRLMSADFHGAVMTVTEARDPIHVGIKGVVVRETQKAFYIITQADKMRLVPKVGVVFTFPWGNSEVKLFGSKLIDRDNGQAGKGGSKERPTIRL